jgi:hypothetical protein
MMHVDGRSVASTHHTDFAFSFGALDNTQPDCLVLGLKRYRFLAAPGDLFLDGFQRFGVLEDRS